MGRQIVFVGVCLYVKDTFTKALELEDMVVALINASRLHQLTIKSQKRFPQDGVRDVLSKNN